MALIERLFPWQNELWRRLMQAHAQERLPHGLLLSGAPGLGKHEFAQALAERLLCRDARNEAMACGQCKSCQLLAAGTHPDLATVAPEEGKKQISVNTVRELRERLTQSAQQGRYRVAIVAPADAMNVNAANALLKTLEEPGPDTILMLVSARPQSVPITVRSRCQNLVLATPGREQARQWLAEQGVAMPEADEALAEAGTPLAALALLKSGELAAQRQFLELLSKVAAGKAEPVAAAARVPADRLTGMLASFQRRIAQMARETDGANPGLFRILDKVTEARALLMNNANVNGQLLIESLLIAWFELHAKLRHSR